MTTAAKRSAYDCETCKDTGYRPVKSGIYTGVAECDCRVKRIAKALGEQCGIPEAFCEKTLDNFQVTGSRGREHALNCAKTYLRMFPAGDPPGLLIGGAPGSGKTHLAVGILRAITQRAIQAKFFDANELLESIRGAMDKENESENEVLLAAVAPQVILLDDIGGRRGTQWGHDTLAQLLTARHNRKRPTIVTTSASDESVRLGAADHTVVLVEQIGVRARGKLLEMCQPVPIAAEDYRLRRGSR